MLIWVSTSVYTYESSQINSASPLPPGGSLLGMKGRDGIPAAAKRVSWDGCGSKCKFPLFVVKSFEGERER